MLEVRPPLPRPVGPAALAASIRGWPPPRTTAAPGPSRPGRPVADGPGGPARVAEGLHLVATGPSNTYLWLDAGAVTVVDTGLPGQGEVVAEALRALGLDRGDVRRVVLTHWHADHSGSAAEIAAWGEVEVCAGRADAAVVRGDAEGRPPLVTDAERPLFEQVRAGVPPAPPCPVHRELDDGDRVDPAGEAVVVATPGHTPGSIAVHFPRLGAVLTGDTAADVDGQVVLGPFHVDRAGAHRSLQRLAALDVEVAGFGHGPPRLGGAARALATAPDPLG